MKKLMNILIILITTVIFAVPIENFVLRNFNDAFEVANLTNKKVVIMFSTPTCPACIEFKRSTLLDEEIQKWLRTEYVFAEIYPTNEIAIFQGDELRYGDLFFVLGARYTPTFVFFDPDQTPVGAITGAYPPEIFLDVLKYLNYDLNNEISLDKFIQEQIGKNIDIQPNTIYLSQNEIERLVYLDPNTKLYDSKKQLDPFTNIVLIDQYKNSSDLDEFYIKIFEENL